MNKTQLAEAVADRVGSKKAAVEAIDAIVDAITTAVADGDKVTLTGFGVFEKATRPEREARNPATGARITVPATAVPKFKPGVGFKERVKFGARH